MSEPEPVESLPHRRHTDAGLSSRDGADTKPAGAREEQKLVNSNDNKQIETVDLEKLARGDEKLPDRECRFRVRIDKEHFLVETHVPTGTDLLKLAGKAPPRFKLIQRMRGGKTRPIGPEEVVDLRAPGIERFHTLACDQTEGEAPARQFTLGEEDVDFLDGLGYQWEALLDGRTRWIIIRKYPIPDGYNYTIADVAIQVPPGYPDCQLDMAYFKPALARTDSVAVKAANATIAVQGATFQRWSRHRTPANPWRPGVDSIATHLLLVDDWLAREFHR